MKFKLKQPTKYMHQNLQQHSNHNSDSHQQNVQSSQQDLYKYPKTQKITQNHKVYKHKKIIKKKNQPSALRLQKINETFQNIYRNSTDLFNDLNIDKTKLEQFSLIKQKNKCKCNKNVKFYCLKCMTKVCSQQFQQIQLPFQIQIIHHQSQKVNKSSALPLKFLTNEISFNYFSSPSSNNNPNNNPQQLIWSSLPKPSPNTFILFPHKNSKTISQINQVQKIQNLIILDCTWFQTDLLVAEMQKNGIQGYKSIYWRYNHHNDEALCSAEAIAFFMREYQKAIHIDKNKQQQKQQIIKKYDNLLFLYCLNLKMIMRQEQSRIESCQNHNKQLANHNKQLDNKNKQLTNKNNRQKSIKEHNKN